MKADRTLLALGAALLLQAALYTLIFYPDYDRPRLGRFISITLALSILWIVSLALANKLSSAVSLRRFLTLALAAGVVFRVVTLVGAEDKTYLSDDVYRYVWDGKLIASGVNPLAYSPERPELDVYADAHIRPHVNHPELATIYPPVSQAVFLAAYLIDSDGIFGFKALTIGFDLLTLLALWKLVKVNRLPGFLVLIYWLAPLTVIEFYLSSHHDIIALPFLILTIVSYTRKKAALTGVFLA
ncbi:MAG: hypothetical protein ACE5GA_10915, partial [Candidatus Zixiibacteriota bacterium]